MKALVSQLGLLIGLSLTGSLAQTPLATLTGRVIDAKTKVALPFATVYLNNSSRGTTADQNGIYHLTAVPLGNHELVGSMLSYQSTRQLLRLTDTRSHTVDLMLEPTDQSLASITVTARHNQAWIRQFRQFSRELLGNQPQARQCTIINPNTLSFQEEKGHLTAQATQPLLIENRALGYRLYYDLLHFDLFRGKMQFAGTSRFEEMKPTDARQQARWQANRMAVYKGSLQHLLASLVAGTHEQAGFLIYRTPLTGEATTQVLPFVRTTDRQYIGPEQVNTLVKPGELPFERRLLSDQPLEVYYNRIYANNSPYHDSPYAYSMLLLPPHKALELTTNGWIIQGNGLDVRGYMGNDRLATLLPADWAPIDGEILLANSVTAGRAGKPDAGLDSLVLLRRRHQERAAPLVYIQTDKSVYCTGDQLWLSAYVLDANRQLPVVGRNGKALQLNLIGSTGQLVQHQWLPLTDGRAATGFRLSDTLPAGTYRLQAYTDLNQPDEGPAFERSLAIYNLRQVRSAGPAADKATAQLNAQGRATTTIDSLDVQFLPEGGRWLAGVPGRLGIKALQANGRGYPVRGRIVDGRGIEAASFTTNALGMGQVVLTPQGGQRYYALIGHKGITQRVTLPAVETEGWTLAVDALPDSGRLIVTARATGRFSQQPVYITLQSREQLVYRQKWLLSKGEAHFSLATASVPAGVCRLTLWDTTRHPRAERLVFIPERSEPIQMRVTTTKPHYDSRQEVVIGLQFRDGDGYPVAGSWSAAVTDADQLPPDTSQVTLRTYLLLTAGLRGSVESPAYYLEPDHLPELDNLLLTQGWRRLPTPASTDSTAGWALSGHVRDKQGQPMAGKTLLLWLSQGDHKELRTAETDVKGAFRLTGLLLTDTVQVRARLAASGLDRPVISFDTSGIRFNPSSGTEIHEFLSADWLREARDRQLAWPALYRDSTARQLAEVTVRAVKRAEDRPLEVVRSSLHLDADALIEVDENGPPFANVFELMMGRLPGVVITRTSMNGYSVVIRGPSSFGGSTPLYILDGVYVTEDILLTINPRTVSRVELLKNATTAGIYGARGTNGVIAIYTRKGAEQQQPPPTSPGIAVLGFAPTREFYVPRYQQADSAAHLDRRDVLFWQPLGQSDAEGLGRLIFPLSDTAKRLRIVLQGVTNEGLPMAFSWELPVR